MTVLFDKCHACLIEEECRTLGCAITRKPTYKGPPPRLSSDEAALLFVTCEGCTTPRKCADVGTCQGPDTPKAKTTGVRKAVHDLKCWPEYFCPTRGKLKTFEVRFNDRDYQEGDRIYLREFIICPTCHGSGQRVQDTAWAMCCPEPHGQYTGRQEIYEISYILRDFHGLQPGYVVLALQSIF